MTGWRKRQVLELAREADLIDDTSASDWYVYQLEHFAELVRADEREVCAKVCEDSVEYAGDTLAQAIRARTDHDPAREPDQEPVAYWNFNNGFSHCMIDQLNEAAKKNPAPLYTTPPQRKPLTDEEVNEFFQGMEPNNGFWLSFARAIEAAHGIKENT